MIRWCVAFAAAGAVCHIMAMLTPDSSPLMVTGVMTNAVILVLIALCLMCSLSLWRRPTDRSATAMLVVTAVMLVVHPVLALVGHSHSVGNSGWPLLSGWPLFGAVAFALDAAVLVSLAAWLRRLHRKVALETDVSLETEVVLETTVS